MSSTADLTVSAMTNQYQPVQYAICWMGDSGRFTIAPLALIRCQRHDSEPLESPIRKMAIAQVATPTIPSGSSPTR